jgi:hypothetical protein
MKGSAMRRTIVLAIAAMLVVGVAATAYAGKGNTKPDLDRLPTPRAVVDEHIDALNNCDVDRLMAQYPKSIHIILPDGGQAVGRDEVLALFEGFCLPFEEGGLNGLQFSEIESWKIHKTINMQWMANADFLCEPYYGADAYETRSGLMAAQVTTFDGTKLKFVGTDC